MTAVPQPPAHLLTVTEYAALGEDDRFRYELQEGRLLMSPSPTPYHMVVMAKLIVEMDPQLPAGLRVVPDVDVDLELTAPRKPGFSRRPDLVVVDRRSVDRVQEEGGLLRASEVLVVVEIVSPGSRRTDYVIKRGEYADAGIRYYWVVDLEPPVSLLPCHLAGEFGYRDAGEVSGTFTATEPFDIRLRLDQLL